MDTEHTLSSVIPPSPNTQPNQPIPFLNAANGATPISKKPGVVDRHELGAEAGRRGTQKPNSQDAQSTAEGSENTAVGYGLSKRISNLEEDAEEIARTLQVMQEQIKSLEDRLNGKEA